MRRAKILCTLGPSSTAPEVLRELVAAGMDAVRLNFSHGTADDHRAALALVRTIAREAEVPLPVLQDLQGPKIRVGRLPDEGLLLREGEDVTVHPGELPQHPGDIPISYDALPRDARPGDSLLLDDGLMRLEVLATDGARIRCRVRTGGRLLSRKGVNLPGVALSTSSLTEKDRRDLAVGLEIGVDLVALSFVRQAEDVRELRRLIREAGATTPIIAKIEKPEAVENLSAILEEADGVMVARGDLGVELPPPRVPLLQKRMVEEANAAGKLVIIATQMLDSMIRHPRPTRAEVSDVAPAVMQGADATMLSGETAVGAYPIEAVRMMAAIVEEVEAGQAAFPVPQDPAMIPGHTPSASAVGRAAVRAARDLDAACLAVFSGSGRTAALVSDYRPRCPVLAFTPQPEVYRRMGLLWGVTPVLVDGAQPSPEAALALARGKATELGIARRGGRLILTMGRPTGPGRQTNLMWVQEL